MAILEWPALTALGHPLETDERSFGELRRSNDLADDAGALRQRLQDDGYLYLPGYLDRALVLDSRREIAGILAEEGLLDATRPATEAFLAPEGRSARSGVRNDIARRVEPLQQLLYAGRMMAFYRHLLGGEVRHFDYTWLRAVQPGRATAPHYDIVFMGRGTPNLMTAWTPLGDVSLDLGGLIVLEGSHKLQRLRATYGARDVDTYCSNRANNAPWAANEKRWSGTLSRNPARLRATLGGRWLTAEYRAGDLLTFTMYTAHASLDNRTDRVRLSCDTRYQLASEPADERWIGEAPAAHGLASRRGRIC